MADLSSLHLPLTVGWHVFVSVNKTRSSGTLQIVTARQQQVLAAPPLRQQSPQQLWVDRRGMPARLFPYLILPTSAHHWRCLLNVVSSCMGRRRIDLSLWSLAMKSKLQSDGLLQGFYSFSPTLSGQSHRQAVPEGLLPACMQKYLLIKSEQSKTSLLGRSLALS